MHDFTARQTSRLTAVLVTLSLSIAACSGVSSPTHVPGGTTSSESSSGPAAASTDTGGAGSPSDTTVTGSVVSSGLYDATWTWQSGNAANVGIGGVTLTSDKGTFGNIQVLADGSITFSSGASELKSGSYTGTGAQVHLKDASGTKLPCGWTLDNDVTGTDGVLHLKGTMDVIGTAFGCPT